MGTRGPVPKRSDERRRQNKPATATGEITQAPAADGVVAPEPNGEWHEVAHRWYLSLAASGQSRFYEPSDWATAYLIAESMSRDLNEQVVGITDSGTKVYAEIPLKGASLSAYLKAFSNLLTTEGDRRRASIELQRGLVVDPDEDASVTALADYRAALEG
jgi:hypothetical protein